jgi:hypothetical protein
MSAVRTPRCAPHVAAELAQRSDQAEWWPEFLTAMRAGAPLSRSRG